MSNASQSLSLGSTVSPLDGFQGVVVRARPGLFYKLGLAVVAFAMVLLPTIYVALILATAWAVFFHLTKDAWLVDSTSLAIYRLLAYLGPAAVGGILVFFMVKPFFAATEKEIEPLVLDPTREQLLFSFVEKICALVKA